MRGIVFHKHILYPMFNLWFNLCYFFTYKSEDCFSWALPFTVTIHMLTLLLLNSKIHFSFFTHALLYNYIIMSSLCTSILLCNDCCGVHWLHSQLVNSADPDETAPAGAVSSGSSLFTGRYIDVNSKRRVNAYAD